MPTPERNRRSLPRLIQEEDLTFAEKQQRIAAGEYKEQIDEQQNNENYKNNQNLSQNNAKFGATKMLEVCYADFIELTRWIDEIEHYVHYAGDGPDSYAGKLVSEINSAVQTFKQGRMSFLPPPATVGRRNRIGSLRSS